MKKYQINKVGETTVGGYTLPTGFVLEVIAATRSAAIYALTVVTCEASGKPVLRDQEANVAAADLEFVYDPTDPTNGNAGSENTLLALHFEPLLDTWFGGGNWVAI